MIIRFYIAKYLNIRVKEVKETDRIIEGSNHFHALKHFSLRVFVNLLLALFVGMAAEIILGLKFALKRKMNLLQYLFSKH